MATVESKFVLFPGWEKAVEELPGVQAALGAVGGVVVTRMKASVRGRGTSAFKRRAFVEKDNERPGEWNAGTRYRIAHIFEFGSGNTRPHGWLRNAAMGLPNTRYEPNAR